MSEVIVFLIAFTACALAVAMIAIAVAFSVVVRNYELKNSPKNNVKEKKEES